MKCKWAVMSTITSTGEPSTWLLSSQIDELFFCHCPLLTSLEGGLPGAGRERPGVGAGAEKGQIARGELEPRGPFTPGRDLHAPSPIPRAPRWLPPPPRTGSPPAVPVGHWGSPGCHAGKPPRLANELAEARPVCSTGKLCGGTGAHWG